MRRIKLTIIFLFFLPVLLVSEKFLPSFKISGQSGSLSAPTGIVASDGSYSTKVGISWDTIRGATAYMIFRSTVNNLANAESLGTTAAPFFFDSNAVAGQTYFY